jgi:hypothetical protein
MSKGGDDINDSNETLAKNERNKLQNLPGIKLNASDVIERKKDEEDDNEKIKPKPQENGGIIAKRRKIISTIFGDKPTAYSTDQVSKCAKYWAVKNYIQEERLRTGKCVSCQAIGFEGVARMKSVFEDFNSLVEEWQPYQTAVFHMCVNTMIRNILGPDKDRCLSSVMAANNWTKIEDEVLVLAYRGSGKTWLLSGAITAFMANVPNFSACIYAGTKSKTMDFYNGIRGQYLNLMKHNPERSRGIRIKETADILVAQYSDDDVRWIRPFSTFGMVRHYFFILIFFIFIANAYAMRCDIVTLILLYTCAFFSVYCVCFLSTGI